MCTVSMIGDHYRDTLPQKKYWQYIDPHPLTNPNPFPLNYQPTITRAEFDDLKKTVEEMKALLIRAKKYDEENGEKDCEMDEKVALLKHVAKIVGVDLEDVFGKPA